MPIQAHALPWASLASIFEYRPANSGIPGDQSPDINPRKLETQAQQIRHFAAVFKDVLEEHTENLRAKIKSPEQYENRASIWQHSDLNMKSSADSEEAKLTGISTEGKPTPDDRRMSSSQAVECSHKLRRQISLVQSGWTSEQETRPIFVDDFQVMYEPYQKELSGRMAEFQTLETWSRPETASSLQDIEKDPSKDRDYIVWQNERTRSDILKLLIIDIARDSGSWSRTTDLDTLLLLKYHPKVNLRQYVNIHLWCCNIFCGFISLEDFALQFLLYFGILETMINHGETRLLSMIDPDTRAYMTLVSLRRFVLQVTRPHGYLAETIPFKMSWKTRKFDDDDPYLAKTITTDLFSEPDELYAMYKWQWKILVLSNLIHSHGRGTIDWERRILRQVDGLFRYSLFTREFWER